VVQHSTQDSTTHLVPSEIPKQLDIAQISVYRLRFLSAGLFLLLPLVNLLHPSPWQRWIRTIHGMGAMCALLVMLKRLLPVALQIRLSKLYLYQQASRKFRRWMEQIRQQKLPIA
jgi:hypothetical protein